MCKKRFFVIILSLVITSCLTVIGQDTSQAEISCDPEVLNKALEERSVQWENGPVVNTEYTRYGVLRTGKALTEEGGTDTSESCDGNVYMLDIYNKILK